MAHHILGAGIGVHALQGGIDLRGGIAQLLQSGMGQGGIVALLHGSGGSGMELDFSTGPAVASVPVQSNSTALATAALQELGYSSAEISAALKGVDPKATTEEMVRYALRAMVMK